MPKAFVSYSSKDLPDVEALVSALEKRGIECWFAAREIGPSTDYAAEIPAGLESCDAIVILLSKDSIRSRHVRREIEMADKIGLKFYPIRLLDVALSNEMAYFLKVGEWLDLHTGSHEKTYDRLANAIHSGQSLTQGNRKKRLMVGVSILLVASLALVYLYVLFSQRIAQLETQLKPGTDSESVTQLSDNSASQFDPAVDFDRGLSPSSLSQLQSASISFPDFAPEDQSVSASLYGQILGGPLNKVGQVRALPTVEYGQNVIRIPVLGIVKSYRLCMIFKKKNDAGELQTMMFSKLFQAHTNLDPNQVLKPVPKNTDCDSALGFAKTAEFEKRLKKAIRIKKIEDSETLIFAGQFQQASLREANYEMNFSTLQPEGKGYPESADAYLFGSDDGKSWKLLREAPLSRGFSFAYRIFYRRFVPNYVRVCAVTRLLSGEDYFESIRVFRSLGVSGEFEEISSAKKNSIIFGNEGICAREATAYQLKNPRIEITPLTEILSADSGGEFDTAERKRAVSELKAGRPSPFGPRVNGLRIGMAFDDAVAAIKSILPEATVKNIPFSGEFARVVHFTDGQRYRTVTLAQFKSVAALAGATFTYTPEGKPTPTRDVMAYAKKLFGPDVAKVRKAYGNSAKAAWGTRKDVWCEYAAFGEPVLVAAYDSQKCNGLFLESRISYGGNGTAFNDVGLFDWQMYLELK